MITPMPEDYVFPNYTVNASYTREATREELIELFNDPVRFEELKEKAQTAELSICSTTFMPYKVIDGVRYDLETMVDVETRGF